MSAYLSNWMIDTTIPFAAEMRSLVSLPPETWTIRRLDDGADMAHFPRDDDGLDRARRMLRVLGDGFDVLATVTRRQCGARAGYYHAQQPKTPERVEWLIESEVVN